MSFNDYKINMKPFQLPCSSKVDFMVRTGVVHATDNSLQELEEVPKKQGKNENSLKCLDISPEK